MRQYKIALIFSGDKVKEEASKYIIPRCDLDFNFSFATGVT